MKSRNTIILLILTLGIAGYVFFVERHIPSTRAAAEAEKTLAQFDAAKITGMDLTNGDVTIQLRKNGDEWSMLSPVKDRVNAASIAPILQAANNLEKTSVVDKLGEGEKLRSAQKDYGVQKAKIRLQLFGEGAPPTMHFGKDTAFEGKIYARLDKEDSVAVVSSALRNLLVKDVSEFRDHRLSWLESSKVSGVLFKTSGGEIELSQTGDNWNIKTPIQARAANSKVLDLISSVNNISIQEFVTQDEANLDKFGLAEPRGSITFSALDREEKIRIEVGSATEKDPAKIYVRVPGRPSVFVVPKNIGDALAVKPNDLRDNNLARVSPDLIDRIVIEKPGQPPLVLARNQEKWKFAGDDKPANEIEVTRMLEVVNNTETTGFVADTASELASYGLDVPVLTVRLSSYSRENTAEAPKGETPLATIQFGKTDGDKLYARVAEEPFVVSVAPGILTNLASTGLAYRSLAINQLDPSDVVSITFQSPNQTPVIVSRDGQKWKSSIEPPSSNLEEIAAAIAKLRAVKWLTSPPADPGFANAKTVVYQTKTATHQLLLGTLAEDGNTFAKIDDDGEVFLVSVDTVQALTPKK